LKLAFGTTLLERGLQATGIDGIGQYCQELLYQFGENPQALTVLPYTFGLKTSNLNAHTHRFPSYGRYAIASQLKNNHASWFDSVDLVHATDQLMPLCQKPVIATVMDVIPLSHPQFIKSPSRFLKANLWKYLTRRAARIITISEFSKTQIARYFDYPTERIDVIPLGVNAQYFERLSEQMKNDVLCRLGINTSFFIFIGSIQPRKNLQRLLLAHAKLPRDLARQFPLVIAGKVAWDDGDILSSIERGVAEKRCIYLNYVSDLEKRCLLQSAVAMPFVSLYEGFGLPILEAFASQLPVLTSNCSAMPEVAQSAALLVDPIQESAITEALLELIDNRNRYEELQAAGLARAHEYSWENTFMQTLASYQKVT